MEGTEGYLPFEISSNMEGMNMKSIWLGFDKG